MADTHWLGTQSHPPGHAHSDRSEAQAEEVSSVLVIGQLHTRRCTGVWGWALAVNAVSGYNLKLNFGTSNHYNGIQSLTAPMNTGGLGAGGIFTSIVKFNNKLTHSILKQLSLHFFQIFMYIFQFLRPKHDCHIRKIHFLFYIRTMKATLLSIKNTLIRICICIK